EASLERLQMDYVDIYMCHRPDPDTPLEETVRAMEDLARAGKILYWGISEWPASMIVRANAMAREIGARPMAVSQPRYNLLYRYPEQLLFPTTEEEGIGNVVFSPLAHGMLTGKYKPGAAPPEDSRAADDRQNAVIKNMYWKEDYMARGQALARIAEELGTAPATLAIAWCLRTPHVSSVILGASKIAQLKENLAAANLKIPDDVIQQLNELYPASEAIPQA
ncbi:MAG: aldo/keto reductase, partial [Candidatus Hydrogenedentes bacterium]|nr:aldo/keto reductase [Candidatus Hydrogenedentota bacterium]